MSLGLNRFKKAQECFYDKAKSELLNGKKESCWIWFVFPQLKGIGTSFMSNYYGLANLEEAKAYYKDKYLRKHLLEVCRIVLKMGNYDELFECFGAIDTQKVHACVSLFSVVTKNRIFNKIIDIFFGGFFHGKTGILL